MVAVRAAGRVRDVGTGGSRMSRNAGTLMPVPDASQ